MWEFIKYCFKCLLMAIPASFGDVPEGMTIKDAIVGIITMGVLFALAMGALWLLGVIVNKFR